MKKLFNYLLFFIIFFIAFYFFYLKNNKNRNLINKGNQIVLKIEDFRKANSRLPYSLTEIGTKDTEEGPLYYEIKDSLYYILYYNIGFDDSNIYFSDTKKWEKLMRPIIKE